MNANDIAAKLTAEEAERLRNHPIWQACQPMSWPQMLRDPECTAAALPVLAAEAALSLELIIGAFGAVPFTEEQLLQAARPGIAGAALRLGLHLLGESGIVFAVRRGWGEKLYVLPLDSLLPWQAAIRRAAEQDRQDEPQSANRSSWPHMPHVQRLDVVDAYDVDAIEGDEGGGVYVPPLSLQLLHAMSQMADAGMKLTAKRVLTKRTIAKAAGQLHLQDEALSALTMPSSAGTAPSVEASYPPALLFLLQTAFRFGWLRDRNGSLELVNEAWNEWLAAAPAEREGRLLRQLIAAVCGRSAAAAAGAAVLCLLEAGVWYKTDALEAVCLESRRLLAKPHRPMLAAWLRLFGQLGWIEQGTDRNGGGTVVRWRIEPQPYKREDEASGDEPQWLDWGAAEVELTPDGDLYANERCSYAVRWQLERIAERRRTDLTTVYRLSAASVKRAAAAGFSRESLIAYMEELIQERLPDTVRAMIELGMAESSANVNELRSRISEDMRDAAEAEPTSALFGQTDDEAAYELIQERTAVKHLFAGIDDIPSMWLKQFRSYHLSTRRDLMEQALRWRTTVKLNCAGAITLFVPERIVDEDKGWAVSGYRQQEREPAAMKLYPNMWDEMMLLLPVPAGG